MKRALLGLIVLLVTTPIFPSTRIIPIAGHLPGANGTTWTTDVDLANHGSAPAVVDLVFYPEDGVARGRSITLGAGQSILLEDAVNPASFSGTNPPSWLGQLEVRSPAGITASAHIFTAAPSGGTFGSTYPDFDPSTLSMSGAMTGLISSSRYRTNVAFANASGETASFDYVIRRESGSVAATRHIDVPAHSTRQLSLLEHLTPSDDRLLLTWSSSAPGYAVGSILDNKSGDPTTAPSTSGGDTTLFIPVVGKTGGSLSTFWTTSIAVSNTTDIAGSVSFVYHDGASLLTYTKTAPIGPHGTVKAEDINDYIGAPLGTGSLEVKSTVRLVGSGRVFNTQSDGSTFGSAVLPQERVVRASRVRISGIRRDAEYRLNVGISNDDLLQTGGVVRLFDDHGAEVESEPFHAGHQSSVQVAMNHGAAEVHAGEVEVETENGVAVTVIASNIDNLSGDTVMHEAEQENERQHEIEMELTPRVAVAGVPVTFSMVNPGSSVAGVSWNFGDGTTATGLTATHTYASAGEFEVTVEVTLNGGAVVRYREDVHVSGSGGTVPGTIDFTFAPSAPAAGQQVIFTASGTGGGTFNWKFPGDVRKSGSVVTFTFASAGSYEVELELEREGSETAHVTHIVTVGGGSGTPAATSIDFSWSPDPPHAGQTVSFSATFNQQPPAGSTVKWRFSDSARPTGTNVTFTFAAPGNYTVRAELEQPGQPSIEREKTVVVLP